MDLGGGCGNGHRDRGFIIGPLGNPSEFPLTSNFLALLYLETAKNLTLSTYEGFFVGQKQGNC